MTNCTPTASIPDQLEILFRRSYQTSSLKFTKRYKTGMIGEIINAGKIERMVCLLTLLETTAASTELRMSSIVFETAGTRRTAVDVRRIVTNHNGSIKK